MSFGMFEAQITSEDEGKRQVREAANKLAAATYDVRERFGSFLFAAKDLAEYNDRLALSKNDILRTIEPHVFPRTGTVRRVLKPLEREFKSLQESRTRTAMRRQAAGEDDLYSLFGVDKPKSPGLNESPFTGGNFDPTKIPGVKGGPNTPGPNDPTGGLLGAPYADKDAPQTPAAAATPASKSTTPATPAPTSAPSGGSDPQSFKDGGPRNETPSIDSTSREPGDPIAAGDYKIQSGDTLADIAQRSGYGDNYQALADANDIADPDMIYAGDTINIPGQGGDSSSSSSSAASPSTADAPLAAEAGGSSPATPGMDNLGTGMPSMPSSPSPLPTSGPGAAALANDAAAAAAPLGGDYKGASRRAAARRRADFERNLDTDVTFHPHEGELEPEGNFKKWLDSVAQGAEGKVDRNFGGTFPGGTDHDGDPAKTDFVKDSTRRFASWCRANRLRPTLAALDHYRPNDREYITIAADLQRLAGQHDIKTPWSDDFDQQVNPYSGEAGAEIQMRKQDPKDRSDYAPKEPYWPEPGGKHRAEARRRTAAPDYLQKADEALTNLLNQKAEEFQQTIAPLQQALQTVQQAEQEAAAANPMNVMPPAGTVNVLPPAPGGDPSAQGGAGGGMDPSALAGLMGGGAPGGDPSMGGDPSQQPQQMMARRRQAKNVEELWNQFTQNETLRGGQPDLDTFAQKYKVGPKALQRIKQKSMGTTAARRRGY